MEIALIVVGGVIVITAISGVFDYLGKKRKAGGADLGKRVAELEGRVVALEGKVGERDDKIAQLESDLSFVNKLIEDKSK